MSKSRNIGHKNRKRQSITNPKPKLLWTPPVKVKPSKVTGPTVNPKVRPNHCFWCDIWLTPYLNDGLPQLPTSRTIDHVIPRSKGGRNTRINRVPACHDCNQRKGAILPTNKVLGQLGLPYQPDDAE